MLKVSGAPPDALPSASAPAVILPDFDDAEGDDFGAGFEYDDAVS